MQRLVASVDFERVLRSRSRAQSAHFALHHSTESPPAKLSTDRNQPGAAPVDDSIGGSRPQWLGAVVPKRHARRAVTRSLLKRQIYAAAERHRPRLDGGCWVVRLRQPFDRAEYPSAASTALKRVVSGELDALFAACSTALTRPDDVGLSAAAP